MSPSAQGNGASALVQACNRGGRTTPALLLLMVSAPPAGWSLDRIARLSRMSRKRVECAVWRLRRRKPPVLVVTRGSPVHVRLADDCWPACARCGRPHDPTMMCIAVHV